MHDFEHQEILVLTWSEYLDPEVVTEFENKLNAKIKFVYYESDDVRTEILVADAEKSYDVVPTSGLDVQKYVRQDLLESKRNPDIPNDRHMKPRWTNALPKTEMHAIPYFLGTLGIAYLRDLISKLMRGERARCSSASIRPMPVKKFTDAPSAFVFRSKHSCC